MKPSNALADEELYNAAWSNDLEEARKLLEHAPHVNVNRHSSRGWPPLHIAADQGHTAMVQMLLDHGANPNLLSQTNRANNAVWSPLMPAVSFPEILVLLVQAGAAIDYQEASQRRTVLHLACEYNQENSVIALLKMGADRTLRDKDGFTPYERAIKFNAEETVCAWDLYAAAENAHQVLHDFEANDLSRL